MPSSIYHNGRIQTMDSRATYVNAIAICGDRILAVGKNDEILALKTSGTELIDLKGKVMYPGFIDGHSHFLMSGVMRSFQIDLSSPPVGVVKNMAELKARVAELAAKLEEGEWVLGFGYDDTLLAESRHPLAKDLDEITTKHPVFLKHVSGHLATCNSLALETGGINKDTPDPPGGRICRDEHGIPTGVLEEPEAMLLVYDQFPGYNEEQYIEGYKYACQWYARKGVTTAQDGGLHGGNYAIYMRAAKEKYPTAIRVQLLPRQQFSKEPTKLTPGLQMYNNMLSMGAVKVFYDGSIQGYTGYLSNPYYKQPEHPEAPWYRGWPVLSCNELEDLIIHYHRKGCQIAVHGNGDDAIEGILCAFETAQKKYPREDARHIIIHCQTIREDQLDRMKRLGVLPSFFILHTYYWGDRHREIFLGPERARRISPLASAKRRDITYTVHSDDYVTPIDQLLAVWSAVTRQTSSGKILGEEQCVPVLDGMRSITSWAAKQNFEEDLKGTLEPGKLADMVLLDDDPLTVEPDAIRDIGIVGTIVGDTLIYGQLP